MTRLKYLHYKHGAWYFVRGGAWEHLSRDLNVALTEYARRMATPQGGIAALVDAAHLAMRPRLAESTWNQYRLAARIIKRKLVEFQPHEVRPKHIAQVMLSLAASPNLGNKVLSFARQMFHYALENQLVESNPAIGVRRHREKKRERLLSPQEFDAIHAHASPRLQCMMELWRGCGQRVMDVVRLGERQLLEQGIYFEQQKTGTRLIVRWTPELRDAVERARALNPVRSLVLFPARRGKRKGQSVAYSTVHDDWIRACRAAGVEDADLRDLRPVALTEAKRQGKDPTALAGHTDKRTTTIYLRDKEIPLVDGPVFRQPLDAGQKA